jgi:hypothetical protein
MALNPPSKVKVKLVSGLGTILEKHRWHFTYFPWPSSTSKDLHCLPRNRFAHELDFDLSGVVMAGGPSVSSGHKVYSRIQEKLRGSIAEYALPVPSTTTPNPQIS